MKHISILSLFLFCVIHLSATEVCIDMPRTLLGRDFVIAARVEKVTNPVELGKMKVYAGLRVYNPQIISFSLCNDSVVVTAKDSKRGPQRIALHVITSSSDMLKIDADNLFLSILKGVDILSGKHQPGVMNKEKTHIARCKGDASHLEVSVDYCYEKESMPFSITVRKSLLLLNEQPMTPRTVSPLVGYKSTNGKHLNRFDLSNGKSITFYISDEFSPLWKSAIKQGIEDWNRAFAKIGMPKVMKAVGYEEAGSGFDPFDITNNCFFMVDSDFANAQGNHWTDPRSGEILQADVQFYSAVGEKLKTWLLLHTGAYNADVADGNVADSVMHRMIRYAAAHEIGHCLGLEHNYRASFAYPTDSLRDAAFCLVNGTTPSIMDYARFNYVAQRGDGVKYVYPPVLGDYDVYAIEAGYGNFADDASYKAFIDEHQSSPRYQYSKLRISTLPEDEAVQTSDLGNDHLASTRYGIKNISQLPVEVLKSLKAADVYSFYFQLLMHVVPCLDRAEVKTFLETELTEGYKMLNSEKMQSVYGNQSAEIESRRADFIASVSKKYKLDIPADPLSSGMWMAHQLVSDDVFSLLKKDGIKLSKKDIYEINKRCLAGAALSMSGDNGIGTPFATASFVSKDGLVMTNFHCVSNYVQRLAKGDNDYMTYGCWASKREEEAPLFNLQVHQVLSVEDVTAEVLKGTEGLDADARDNKADLQAREMMKSRDDEGGITRRVYGMMGGQQYVLVKYRTFSDVRIVACPPMWLGAYGGDDDNWRWPRYSCDFAFLRVYVTPEGEATDYSKRNVPYHPQSYLKFAKKPVSEGDLAMVMGYPSQTRKNIPAIALDKIVNRDTQLRVNMLKAKIDYLRECSKGATGTALSGYNVRIGKLMNVYLRSKGEIDGVRSTGLVDAKRQEDLALQEWINASDERKARYGENLIAQIDSVYSLLTVYNHMDEAFSQFVGSGAGIIPLAGKFEKLLAIDRAKRKSRVKDMEFELPEIRRNIREFFPSISMKEDCGMMKTLLPLYLKAVDEKYLPEALKQGADAHCTGTKLADAGLAGALKQGADAHCTGAKLADAGFAGALKQGADAHCTGTGSVGAGLAGGNCCPVDVERLYATSLLADSARLERFLDECIEKGTAALANDTLYRICIDIYVNRVQKQNREATPLRRLNTKLYSVYMRAKGEKNSNMLMPYDANHTLRFSTGKVRSTNSVADMLQRKDQVSAKFRSLLESSSALPMACFTTNAETVAGNSGSAVVNAKGELIGLNFDRTLQSAYSIYRNDPLRMCNIAVSTDYILWVIRNLSRSQYILDEIAR